MALMFFVVVFLSFLFFLKQLTEEYAKQILSVTGTDATGEAHGEFSCCFVIFHAGQGA